MAKYACFFEIHVKARNNTDAVCIARDSLKHSGACLSVVELPRTAKVVE